MTAATQYALAKTERGEPDPVRSEDQNVAYYAAINKLTPEADGVSIMDVVQVLLYFEKTLK